MNVRRFITESPRRSIEVQPCYAYAQHLDAAAHDRLWPTAVDSVEGMQPEGANLSYGSGPDFVVADVAKLFNPLIR
jgi:hypothetical protein